MPTLAMASEPHLSARAKDPDMSWGFEEGDEIRPGLHALKLLGGGRRYEAYLAHDEGLLALVVAKILRPSRAADAASLKGLAAEFEGLCALNHPVIARCFHATLTGDRPHITLEFLEGPRLSTLVRKYGPLPLEQLIPLAVQLCSALHYMHNQRITHLDVKPRNIIMGAPPRLIDLSIARSFEDAAALTVPVGTDAYMAPEQCDPTGAYSLGPAADRSHVVRGGHGGAALPGIGRAAESLSAALLRATAVRPDGSRADRATDQVLFAQEPGRPSQRARACNCSGAAPRRTTSAPRTGQAAAQVAMKQVDEISLTPASRASQIRWITRRVRSR